MSSAMLTPAPVGPPRNVELPFPKPLRILHVTASIAPSAGEPATVVTRLAAAQAARGHQVTIVSALKPRDRVVYQKATRHIPHFDRVRVLLCPWTTHLGGWFGQRLKPIYQSLLPFVDVLHLHGLWDPMLLVAAGEARRHGVPYIVRPCGTLDPWSLQQCRLRKKIALALSHKKMLDRAALIHTHNPDEARLIEPLHIAAPTTIIPNGVFLDEIDDTPPDDSLFARFPALLTHPYVLFLGRLHFKKGLDILAAAFSKLAARNKDVHLLVAGPDGGAQASFLREIQSHGLAERVCLSGLLVGSGKHTAYSNATCFCLPSRQEFSLSITEAMASRVPVAISTDCHFPEVAAIGAGKIFPLDPDAAASALAEILAAPLEQRHRMGDAGRAYVEEHLLWEQIAQQTTEAYATLVSRASSPQP
jgi:glycosyltransferase involved in cell wall biosynthesis